MSDQITIASDGVELSAEDRGDGRAVVLLHGLAATRHYVVMGSRALERNGYQVVSYDARGHGQSAGAARADAYTYADLSDDLVRVIDRLDLGRVTLAGVSMGAHTAVRCALQHPDRIAGLVVVTPAFDPERVETEENASWHRLAEGLRADGIDGFMTAYDPAVTGEWREAVMTFTRQRLERHRDLDAVADALDVVPESRPFESWDELAALDCPVTVVGSRDEADPTHPLAVAEHYVAAIDGAELRVEDPGHSPLAWQGAQLSSVIANVISRADY